MAPEGLENFVQGMDFWAGRLIFGQNGIVGQSRIFLVRVDNAWFRWHARKPFYGLRLSIVEPKPFAGRSFVSRLDCTPNSPWCKSGFVSKNI